MDEQAGKYRIIRKNLLWLGMWCMLLAGCSDGQGQNTGPTPSPTFPIENEDTGTSEPEQPKGYCFVYKETELAIDMEAEQILLELGSPKTYFEAPSCAIEGSIRTYGYGSFEIDTYELDGKEYISCIYFKDDTVTTQEGAFLFMPQEQLFSIYGENYSEEVGMIVYNKDNMKLKFLLSEGKVTSIQYASLVTEIKQ